jgi:parvulin-like peptidyl-prolyl isomerase
MKRSTVDAMSLPSLPLRAFPGHPPLARRAAAPAPHAFLIVGILLAAPAAGPARAAEPPAASTPDVAGASAVIRVGDEPISQAELEDAVRRDVQRRLLDPAAQRRLTAETVERLVDERLLRREVEARQVTVDEEEVTAAVTKMRGQLSQRNVPLETFLAQSGHDEASLRGQIRLEIGLNKLLLPKLTSDALEAAFTAHRRDIDGTLVRASHIVLRPDPGRGPDAVAFLERQAARLRSEILQETVGFAEAARRHSAGPSRRQGGDIGYFPRSGGLDEEFSRRAFALAKGEMSQPFATASGVHLILVTDVKPGDARPDGLRPVLEKIVAQDAIREILTRGRQTTPIEYAPGVPHFETDADRGRPGRRVVVAGDSPATP